jgi:hypothetical protein
MQCESNECRRTKAVDGDAIEAEEENTDGLWTLGFTIWTRLNRFYFGHGAIVAVGG